MTENREKRNPLIPLMNEGLGELMCRRHFFTYYETFQSVNYETV